jgi:hypothetical protein
MDYWDPINNGVLHPTAIMLAMDHPRRDLIGIALEHMSYRQRARVTFGESADRANRLDLPEMRNLHINQSVPLDIPVA